MNASDVLIAAAGLGLCVASYLLLRWAWPRVGNTPFCRKCGYNLTGVAFEVCPECGRHLKQRRAVRRGVRTPVAFRVFVTAATFVAGAWTAGFHGVRIARETDWLPYYPTAWLLNDLQARVPSHGRIERELVQRFRRGELSSKQTNALGRAMYPIFINVRPTMSIGHSYRAYLGVARYERPFKIYEIKVLEVHMGTAAASIINSEPWSDFIAISPANVGQAQLHVKARVRASDLGIDVVEDFAQRIDVLADDVERIRNENALKQVQDAIQVRGVYITGDMERKPSWYPWWRLNSPIGCDCAFEVIAACDECGEPVVTGFLTIRDHDRLDWQPNAYLPEHLLRFGRATKLDITLRASPEAARSTFDILKIADANITIRDVPFKPGISD